MYQGHSPLGVLMSAKLASTLSEKGFLKKENLN